jgi:hypothetical protein
MARETAERAIPVRLPIADRDRLLAEASFENKLPSNA